VKVAVDFSPRIDCQVAWRRGATHETRLSPSWTKGFNRRSATAPDSVLVRGLKSTATLLLSLRDSSPECGSSENSEEPFERALTGCLPPPVGLTCRSACACRSAPPGFTVSCGAPSCRVGMGQSWKCLSGAATTNGRIRGPEAANGCPAPAGHRTVWWAVGRELPSLVFSTIPCAWGILAAYDLSGRSDKSSG
jgi:hypothetical protein